MEPFNWQDVNNIKSVKRRINGLSHPNDTDLIGLTLAHIAAIYGRT